MITERIAYLAASAATLLALAVAFPPAWPAGYLLCLLGAAVLPGIHSLAAEAIARSWCQVPPQASPQIARALRVATYAGQAVAMAGVGLIGLLSEPY